MSPNEKVDPSRDLRARILDAAQKEASPTRPVQRRRQGLSLAAAGVALVFGIWFFGVHFGHRPPGFVLGAAAAWALVGLSLLPLALPRRSMVGGPARGLVGALLLVPVGLSAAIALSFMLFPETPVADCGLAMDARCAEVGLLLAAAPAAAFFSIRRASGGDPVHPMLTGAVLAVSAATMGGAGLLLHCPVAAPRHLLVGHFGSVAVFALVGFIAAAALRVRRRR